MLGAFFGGKRVAKRGIIYTRGMNLDDFSYTENDRRYINPQVSLNEQNAFIDNLRNMQGQDTAQIRQDTYNLGTAVPSNLGGLAGGSGYFRSRYQTPQTNSMVADLRAAAQSQALSTLLNNEIGKAQKRYQDAYRAAKKRANNSTGGGGTNDPSNYLENLPVRTTNEHGAGPQLPTTPGESGEEETPQGTVSGRKWDSLDTGAAAWTNSALNLIAGPAFGAAQAAYDIYNAANNNPSALEQVFRWINGR